MSVCVAVDSIRKVVTSSIGNIEIPRQKSQQNALSLYLLVQVWAAGVCVCWCRLCASNNNNNSTNTHTHIPMQEFMYMESRNSVSGLIIEVKAKASAAALTHTPTHTHIDKKHRNTHALMDRQTGKQVIEWRLCVCNAFCTLRTSALKVL